MSEKEADEIAGTVLENLCKKEWRNFIASMCGSPHDINMPTYSTDVQTDPIQLANGKMKASMLWHPSKDSCELSATVGGPSGESLVAIGNRIMRKFNEMVSGKIQSRTSLHLVGGSGPTQMAVYSTGDARFFCTVFVWQEKLNGAPANLGLAGRGQWHACKITMNVQIWANGDSRVLDKLDNIQKWFGYDYRADLEQLKKEGFEAACYALGEYVGDHSNDVDEDDNGYASP
jgi:hypothetical protein